MHTHKHKRLIQKMRLSPPLSLFLIWDISSVHSHVIPIMVVLRLLWTFRSVPCELNYQKREKVK